MWRDADTPDPLFSDTLELDLASSSRAWPAPSGPRTGSPCRQPGRADPRRHAGAPGGSADKRVPVQTGENYYDLGHGDVVIAAITSCTNTSNPSVLIGAGLVARKARERGLTVKPWVKTSLAPGSQVVTDYLEGLGPAGRPGRARLRPGRLRLHDLHRQLRAAARADHRGDRLGRAPCRRGAVRQPQLRGPGQSAHPAQLPGLAAPGGRLCACRLLHQGPASASRLARTPTASRSICKRHLAVQPRRSRTIAVQCSRRRCSEQPLCQRLRGSGAVEVDPDLTKAA